MLFDSTPNILRFAHIQRLSLIVKNIQPLASRYSL